MFEFLVEVFLMGVSQILCSAQQEDFTYLAGHSHFYSSPAGLLGRQQVDIGYEKLKLMSGRPMMVTRSK